MAQHPENWRSPLGVHSNVIFNAISPARSDDDVRDDDLDDIARPITVRISCGQSFCEIQCVHRSVVQNPLFLRQFDHHAD